MPIVPGSVGSISAAHSVHVWRDDDDEVGEETFYDDGEEASKAFERLERGGQFQYGGLYAWNFIEHEWECLDAWPEDFTGFDPEDDEE